MSSPPQPSSPTVNASVDYLNYQTSSLHLSSPPLRGLTENLSPTFLTTTNPCLDFFFHVVPDTPPSDLISRLSLAWSFDPLTTLKLVCNLRGVRGTGKSDKQGFYRSALWLYQHHPKTLTMNLKHVAQFGYFKDLPEILYRIVEGPDCRQIAKEEYLSRKRKNRGGRRGRYSRQLRFGSSEEVEEEENGEQERPTVEEECVEEERPAVVVVDKETARVLRKEREAEKLRKGMEKYMNDLEYKNLHNGVAELFAELLKLDVGYLSAGELYKISLAAKWCPSVDKSYDKATMICGNVAKRMFGKELFGEIGEDEYVMRAKGLLRKKVLVPLRRALDLPEVYMSARHWSELKYNRVASVAMKNYKKLFVKHDEERFKEYLEDVKSGKAKIPAGALLPHEIIKCLEDEDGGEVAELQWNRLVEDMKKKGKLDNCIAVCDVSASMEGIPMEVSVALGLLVSELSEEPWKGNVITFSADPQLHAIQGDTLKEKTKFIREMDWGYNTDLQKVFDRLLEVAVNGKVSEEQMVKRVFIFSDMEFDAAIRKYEPYDYKNYVWEEGSEGDDIKDVDSLPEDEIETENASKDCKENVDILPKDSIETGDDVPKDDMDNVLNDQIEYEDDAKTHSESEKKRNDDGEMQRKTDYEVIQMKFKKHGYSKVPEIVFWNLRNSSATPVVCDQPGVALLSGFSKNLLTLFLEGNGIVNPVDVMHLALSGEEYQKLVVYD